jgi:heme/copper-type cytochrome/quinol oxidase subunit 2
LYGIVLATCAVLGVQVAQAQDYVHAHVIEIVADKDSRYKSPVGSKPEITLKAGEKVLLRVTARKAKSWNRDGSIHGFTLLRAGDRTKVPDWNLLLRPGTQEFQLTAPAEPGEYVVVCTVICSEDHEGMNMRVVVAP